MAATYTFGNGWPVESTVEVQADGTLKEVSGKRSVTSKCNEVWTSPGTVFPSVQTWVTAMVAEVGRRAPWFDGRLSYKLSYRPSDAAARSSVVWVPSSRDFLEVRRGDQTKMADKRTWPTLGAWMYAHGSTAKAYSPAASAPAPAPAIQVKEEMPAAVPIVEAVADSRTAVSTGRADGRNDLAAEAVVVAAEPFDSETFKEEYATLKEWIDKQTDPHTYSAGIIQMTTFLLTATASADASAWLKENPAWRYSVRAVIQAYGWKTVHKGARDAATAFLEKF